MTGERWLQSYSGVRATLGLGPGVTTDDEAFAFRHAYCYALTRLHAAPAPEARFVLARDPRPTGEALLRAQAAGLTAACQDLGVRRTTIHLGVLTTPAWQHAVRHLQAHGGVMITASHNALPDNGWKYATGVDTFGVDPAPPGALLSAPEMGHLIRAARAFAPALRPAAEAPAIDDAARADTIARYLEFITRAYGSPAAAGARLIVDPNGGAASGIAARAFESLGAAPIVVNGREGSPAHEIDVERSRPDGTHVLDALAARVRDEHALFGLAYDFDADRGHVTCVDTTGAARIPSPQTTAAMNTAVALALHRRAGDPRRAAVVASDATSRRVHRIAAAFGARVVEVETGEINVVTAMRDLEREGWHAVVGVEGPNGGTVFAGTTCRDGTLVGAGALLAASDPDVRRLAGEALAPGHALAPGLAGFLECLPKQRSLMQASQAPSNWTAAVDRLNEAFPRAFDSTLASAWQRFDIVYSYTRHVGPERPAAAAYGWRATLAAPGREGFLWIRGSKTEAGVARMVADGPDETSARALLDLGRRLLASGTP
jgi:phosphomannomutase